MLKKFLSAAMVAALLSGAVSCKDDEEDPVTPDNNTDTTGTGDNKSDDPTTPAEVTYVLDLDMFNSQVYSDREYITDIVFDLKKNQDVSALTAGEYVDKNSNYRIYTDGTSYYVLSENDSEINLPADCASMFAEMTSLQSVEFNSFNTADVTNMRQMFDGCSSLVTLDLSKFNTAKVTNMNHMFDGCSKLVTIFATESFSVANVEGATMFYGDVALIGGLGTRNEGDGETLAHIDAEGNPGYFTASGSEPYKVLCSFKRDDFKAIDFSAATKIVFDYAKNVEISSMTVVADLGDDITVYQNGTVYYVLSVDEIFAPSDINRLFQNDSKLEYVEFNNFNTDNLTDMNTLFAGCNSLKSVDLSSFNIANVIDLHSLFYECTSLESVKFSNDDPVKCKELRLMFFRCSSLTSVDLSHFTCPLNTTIHQMFYSCTRITSIDLSNLNTENVTDMNYAFGAYYKLKSFDASSFNTKSVTDMASMFNDCEKLATIYASSNFIVPEDANADKIFYCCYDLVGGQGTTYSEYGQALNAASSYIRIDDKDNGNPGLFTAKSEK